ncbi:MAG: hypothetical protein IJ468_14920 [Lachnospiraceae bacterium]|nr:hypothetical protein [Lachnospiraceae bacterium]
MTKHDAMTAYFTPVIQELVKRELNFNFSPESQDSISFITNYSDRRRKKYIGGEEKEYAFTIIIVKSYSTDEDDLNLQAMNFAQGFMDWLEAQNAAKNYPVFPDNCQIRRMENLQNMPNLAGINTEAGLARYMIQCRLIYFEKGAGR